MTRATRALGELRSVVYREHLASDPTHAITSTWKLVAPDRVAYAVDDGSQGIVIGRRRWDRTASGEPWTLSASVVLTQPSAPWGTRFADVHIVRESRGTSVFYRIADPSVYALCDLVCGNVAQRLERQARDRDAFTRSARRTRAAR